MRSGRDTHEERNHAMVLTESMRTIGDAARSPDGTSAASLERDLRERVDGEVRFDAAVETVRICGRHGIPLTSRGGGTSLAGQAGHLMSGEVWPTLEVVVSEVAPELARQMDPETGLALIVP